MIIITEAEAKDRIQKILSLELDRRKNVIRILLQHGKEQGMSEEVQNLFKLCIVDEYAEMVRESLF